jgi:hypothetical protein
VKWQLRICNRATESSSRLLVVISGKCVNSAANKSPEAESQAQTVTSPRSCALIRHACRELLPQKSFRHFCHASAHLKNYKSLFTMKKEREELLQKIEIEITNDESSFHAR